METNLFDPLIRTGCRIDNRQKRQNPNELRNMNNITEFSPMQSSTATTKLRRTFSDANRSRGFAKEPISLFAKDPLTTMSVFSELSSQRYIEKINEEALA